MNHEESYSATFLDEICRLSYQEIMNQQPLVSIIIRTLNRPQMLCEALRSLGLQTYPNVQAIIVNDGGSSLKSLLNELEIKPPYKLIEFDNNAGRCVAGNAGISAADGEFIGFLDDDDILYPDHITELISQFSEDDQIVYSDALQATQELNSQTNHYQTVGFCLKYCEDHSLRRMLEGNFIPFQCLLFRSATLRKEILDAEVPVLEDWDLLIRLSSHYKFKHIQQITSEYRLRLDNSNTTGSMPAVWQKTRKYLNQKHATLIKANGLKYIPIK